MKPTAPSDDDGRDWSGQPYRSTEQRCCGRALGGDQIAAKWDPTPSLIFPMLGALKIKITATHRLTSAKPSAAQVHCDFQSITGQLQTWSLLSGDQPPAHTSHYVALPFTHRTVEMSPRRCSLTLQGALSLAGRWQVEPSRLFEGDFACMISCSVLPTAKIQNIEAEGFRVCVHATMLWLFYRIITVWKCTLQIPSKANSGVVTHGGKEKVLLGFHPFSFFKPHFQIIELISHIWLDPRLAEPFPTELFSLTV